MSTRAIIGKVNNTDSMEYICLQRDGHPDIAGELLSKYYNTDAMSNRLLSLGNLSCLEKTLGYCVAYNEPKTIIMCNLSEAAQVLCTVAKESIADFAYLFIDGHWRCWRIMPNDKATEILLPVYEKSNEFSKEKDDKEMIDMIIEDLKYIRGQVEVIRQVTTDSAVIIDSFLSNICSASKNIETHIRIIKNNL
jgi:hypothetical protein